MELGLDISHNNGPVDFARVKKSGKSFVLLKASEGSSFTDPLFHANLRRACAAGLYVSAYHYFRPSLDAAAQWQHFRHVVGTKCARQIVHALDVEEAGQIGREQLSKSVRAWVDLCFQETGKHPLLYTYPDFNAHFLTPTFGDCPLWVASYPSAGLKGKPAGLAGWSAHTVWQYTDHGSCPGVSGAGTVDLDAFAGDEAALKAYLL